jgi:hypothetical protein
LTEKKTIEEHRSSTELLCQPFLLFLILLHQINQSFVL